MDTKFTKDFDCDEVMGLSKVDAIIVTYNPDINRFKKVVSALSNQIDKLAIVDNGSTNSNKILNVLKNKNFKTECVLLKQNLGLAKGLNIGIKSLKKSDFVLTLDQDTIVNKDAIKTTLENCKKLNRQIEDKTAIIHLNHEKFGKRKIDRFVFNRILLDKSEYERHRGSYKNFFPVKYVIQSGMLIKSEIAHKFNFMNKLFIDQVDREYSSRIKKAGYLILETRKKFVKHKLGSEKRMGGKIIHYENELRLFYFTRNSAYLVKNGQLPIFEYLFEVILFYRRYLLARGLSGFPTLIHIYILATLKGLKGQLGKFEP